MHVFGHGFRTLAVILVSDFVSNVCLLIRSSYELRTRDCEVILFHRFWELFHRLWDCDGRTIHTGLPRSVSVTKYNLHHTHTHTHTHTHKPPKNTECKRNNRNIWSTVYHLVHYLLSSLSLLQHSRDMFCTFLLQQ